MIPKYTWSANNRNGSTNPWPGWTRVGPDLDLPFAIEPCGPDFHLTYGLDWATGWLVRTWSEEMTLYIRASEVGLGEFLESEEVGDELKEKLLEHLAARPWERLGWLLEALKPGEDYPEGGNQ